MPDPFLGTARPLSRAGFERALQALEVDAASLWALLTVETRGFGYMPDRRPKILFERHIFHRRTQGRFDAAQPDLSSAQPGGYQGAAPRNMPACSGRSCSMPAPRWKAPRGASARSWALTPRLSAIRTLRRWWRHSVPARICSWMR